MSGAPFPGRLGSLSARAAWLAPASLVLAALVTLVVVAPTPAAGAGGPVGGAGGPVGGAGGPAVGAGGPVGGAGGPAVARPVRPGSIAGSAAGPTRSTPGLTAAPTAVSTQQGRLATVKARGDAAIAAREATLAADAALAASAAHLSDGDRTALEGLIDDNQAGLAQLRQTIDTDTELSQAVTDVRSIVTSYRIYALVDPKVHLVLAADRGAAAIAGFAPLVASLQTAVAASPRAGASVQGLLSQLQQDVAAAAAVVSQIPGQVLPLTPAGYPANRSTLVAAVGSLASARADLGRAASAAQTIVSALGAA